MRALASALLVLSAGCASQVRPPAWARSTPVGYSYNYVTGAGTGADVSDARAAATEDAYQTLVRSAPRSYQMASFRQEFEILAEESFAEHGSSNLEKTQRVRMDGRVDGEIMAQAFPRLEIVATDLRSCSECAEVTAFVLFRYLKPVSQRRSPPSALGFTARSLALPGWGQMAKGARGRGWALLLGTLGGVGVAAASEWQYRALYDSAATATSQRDRDGYLMRANPRRTVSRGAGALAGGLYAYGLLDAALGQVRFYPSRDWRGVHASVAFQWP
jgi:hypothetical protein